MSQLSQPEINKRLSNLEGWKCSGGFLQKEFTFADFITAFAFMTQLAFTAENLGHHPDWSNAYNKVSIKLTTHDAGGITEKDFAFARKAEEIILAA